MTREEKEIAQYNERVFNILCTEAKRLGWPLYYKDDLFKHDRNALNIADRPRKFIWTIREAGTHLWFPCVYMREFAEWNTVRRDWSGVEVRATDNRETCITCVKAVCSPEWDVGDRLYWFDGDIKRVTLETAIQLITDEVQRQWRAKEVYYKLEKVGAVA